MNTEMNHKTNIENVCLDCLRIFKNIGALSNHIKSCDGNIAHPVNNTESENRRRSNRMTSSVSVSSNSSATNTTARKSCQYCDEFIISGLERHEYTCRRKICPKCSKVFTTTRNTLRHLINIHRVPKNKVHSFWNDTIPNDSQNDLGNESEDEEDDEEVVLSVDCCTLEEIPLKRQRMG